MMATSPDNAPDPDDIPVDVGLTQRGTPRKSTPGHGGARAGAGRKTGSGGNEAYAVIVRAKAKKETFRAQLEELKYRQAAKELVPAIECERAIADIVKTVARTLEGLPDILERDCALSGPVVERVIQVIDAMREDLYRSLTDG
jgi:phage terminase Nu1 subunit (DNA packaging protein)